MESICEEPDKKNHGWNEDGQIHWVKKAFPSDIELLLVDEVEAQAEETENDKDVVVETEHQEPGDESGNDMEEDN